MEALEYMVEAAGIELAASRRTQTLGRLGVELHLLQCALALRPYKRSAFSRT